MARFWKINHFVTFDTLNISSLNKALHSVNPHNSELGIGLYHELPETSRNISRAACVLLWQQHKVLGSIYFTHDKVVDFPKSSHILDPLKLNLRIISAVYQAIYTF